MVQTSVLIFKISPLPCLHEFRPGKGIEDILGWCLSVVIIALRILAQHHIGTFPAIGRDGAGKDPALGFIGILTGYLKVIIRDAYIHEVALELLTGRPGFDNGCRKILGIGDHQLDHAELVPLQVTGDLGQLGLVTDRRKFDLITFHHYEGKNTLFVGISAAVHPFDLDSYGRNSFEAICRHYYPEQLNYRIFQFLELGTGGKRSYYAEHQQE